MAEIERKIVQQGGQIVVSRLFCAKNYKEKVAGWKLDLNRTLDVFSVCSVSRSLQSLIESPIQTELVPNTHMKVADIHRNVLAGQRTDSWVRVIFHPPNLTDHFLGSA